MSPTPALDLVGDLTRLLTEGGTANRAIISSGPAWFVVRGEKRGTELLVEAAASYYLPKEHRPDTARVYALRQEGFAASKEHKGLRRTLAVEDGGATGLAERVVDLVRPLFQSVYGRPEEEEIQIATHLGDRDATRNEHLQRTIRAVAKERTQRNRNRMYMALLGADLLVPTDEAGDLLVFGSLADLPVHGCFTDAEALEYWDPRGMPYRVVPGMQLFPALMQTRMGSLLVNPSGRLGGELFRHEVEALAKAALERQRR